MTESIASDARIGGWQRALVARELYESDGARSRRDVLVDVAVVGATAGLGALAIGDLWRHRGALMNAADLVVGTAACLGLWMRRRRPEPVGLFAITASAFFAMATGAALVALFNAATRVRACWLVGLVALSLTASLLFPLVNPAVAPVLRQRFPGFMATAIAVGWGLFVRVRRELVISLRERAERLEAEREQHVEQAREAERRRIAREMHDVLAHRLSLLSLQAGALELRSDATAEETAQAAAIRTSAATAVEELRDVIAVLREDSGQTTAPPQPMLAQLPALLEESRSAGMRVHARIDVTDADCVPDAVGRTAYRVVQEGLTNARKHAPGGAVQVILDVQAPDRLAVEVVSHGGAAVAAARDGGTGLIGLSERVELVGGRLERGPDGNGRFLLRASLPLRP